MIFRMVCSSCSFFFVRLLQPFLFANKVIDGDDAAVLVNVDADNSESLANGGSVARLGGGSLILVPVPVVRDFATASGTGYIPTVVEFVVAAAAGRDGTTGCNAVWFGRTGTECGATTTATITMRIIITTIQRINTYNHKPTIGNVCLFFSVNRFKAEINSIGNCESFFRSSIRVRFYKVCYQ